MWCLASPLAAGLCVVILGGGPQGPQKAPAQTPAAVGGSPAAGATHHARGLEYAKQGEEDKALQELKRAIELDPNRFEPYKALDDLLSKKGDWDTIIAYWTRFLALQPNNAQAYRERGGAVSHKKNYPGAFQDYKKACSLGDQYSCQDPTGVTP